MDRHIILKSGLGNWLPPMIFPCYVADWGLLPFR